MDEDGGKRREKPDRTPTPEARDIQARRAPATPARPSSGAPARPSGAPARPPAGKGADPAPPANAWAARPVSPPNPRNDPRGSKNAPPTAPKPPAPSPGAATAANAPSPSTSTAPASAGTTDATPKKRGLFGRPKAAAPEKGPKSGGPEAAPAATAGKGPMTAPHKAADPGAGAPAAPDDKPAKKGKKGDKADDKAHEKPKRGLFRRKAKDAAPTDAPAGPDGAADAGQPQEDAGDDTPADGHRQGLRLGEHAKGDFFSRLMARFGKKDAEDEPEQGPKRKAAPEPEPVIEPNDRFKEIETYPIHPPYASVRILYDDEMKEYIYQVLEPALTSTEREILSFIQETLVDTLTVAPEDLNDIDELEFITERFNDVIFDYSIILHEDENEETEIKKKLLYYIRRDFIGQGPIDVMMSDPFIEDISCDGPTTPIFLYHRKYESVRSTVRFGSHEALDGFVIKMAQRAGKHISIAEPILDATMTDGSRLQSTLAKEVSAAGSTFTIRKFRPDPFTPPDLVMFRTMSAEMLAYLWISVQHGSSIMYAGGTASGKTTSLNAILLFIPPQMKIVSIEDTREVNLPHENWIAGITRHGFGPRDQFGRQAGEIDMFQLLKNALRQRPEYIIVGEVRGQEAYSLFQAMATGHAAYGTMHADSVDAVIHRLESDPIKIPRSLLEALDIVSVQIQTRVDGKRVRRTKQISEIVGLDPHTREILTNEVFSWIPNDDSFRFSGVSYVLERIQMEKGLPPGSMVKELKRRAEIISWMIDRRIQDYREVSKVVSAYYKEPETVLSLVRGSLEPEAIPSGLRDIAVRQRKAPDSTKAAVSAAMLAATPGADQIAKQGGHKGASQEAPAEAAKPAEAAQQWPGAGALAEAAQQERAEGGPQEAGATAPEAEAKQASPPAPGKEPESIAEEWLSDREDEARKAREERLRKAKEAAGQDASAEDEGTAAPEGGAPKA